MDCPKCNIEMQTKDIQSIEVDECHKCEGMWFEHDQLRQIKDRVDSDLNWMDFEIWMHPEKFKAKTERYDCPKCATPMHVLDYDKTGVEIDYCATCQGVWLDKDGLHKIILSLENEILTKSMEDYVKATLEEAKELLTGPETFVSEWKEFTTILRFLQYRIISLKPVIHGALVSFQNNPLNR